MKKTLKLMLAFALVALGSTSAWAAGDLENTTQYDTNGFKYKIISVYNTTAAGKVNEVSISQNVYEANGAAAMQIPATVIINVKGKDSDNQDINKAVTFNVVEIAADGFKGLTKPTSIQIGSNVRTIGANAFKGCANVTTITFDPNTNAIAIAGEAFMGTKVTELDLKPTKVTTIDTWFSNAYVLGTPVNTTLTTVKFPTTLATINANAFAGCTALATVEFNANSATPPAQTINAGAFSETAIETLDMTNTRLAILNRLFEKDNVTLKSITLPQTITTLAESALADVILLNSVTFATTDYNGANHPYLGVNSSELTTINQYALSNTLVKSYDFSKCLHLTDLSGGNPFVNPTTTKNKALQTVILPKTSGQVGGDYSPVTAIGTAFANCQALTTITNLEISKITEVVDKAFENDVKLASLEFPTSLDGTNGVKGTPFYGCTTLATLTFNTVAGTATAIGNGANLFDDATKGVLTALYIKGDFAGSINANAFSNCTNLTTVEISNGKTITGSIVAGAIQLSNDAASTVTLGKLSADLGNGGIVGPVGTYAATVTIGDIATPQTAAAIVTKNIGTITLGVVSVDLEVAALGNAATITFGGNITGSVLKTASLPNDRLTTINFGSITIKNAADVINGISGTSTKNPFDETEAPNLANVSWNPAVAPVNKVFAKDAFGSVSVGAAAKVTLHTTEAVADLYGRAEANLYNIVFDAALTPAEPEVASTITVEGKDGGTYFWGIYYNSDAIKKYYINDTNDDEEDVMVYSAFVDGAEQTIYFDPLARDNHRFIVAPKQAVMVRVKGTHSVNTYETGDNPTMRYTSGGVILNDLLYASAVLSWDYLSTNFVGYDLYASLNIAKKGAIEFGKVSIDNPGYIAKGKLYVKTTPAPATSNLRIVFLDNTDEAATIIESIQSKKVANNGKIYNMQGIEVSGSYKGFVIKNGKKIYQK